MEGAAASERRELRLEAELDAGAVRRQPCQLGVAGGASETVVVTEGGAATVRLP